MPGPLRSKFPRAAVVDAEIKPCSLCLRCVRACPTGALKYHRRTWTLNLQLCHRCGECTAVCPNQLISAPGQGTAVN